MRSLLKIFYKLFTKQTVPLVISSFIDGYTNDILLKAISWIETNPTTNTFCSADRKIGRRQEVSRYQILPKNWQYYANGNNYKPANPKHAKIIATKIIEARLITFKRMYNRQPTLREFYLLWNAPAYITGYKRNIIIHPAIMQRAERFINICQSL